MYHHVYDASGVKEDEGKKKKRRADGGIGLGRGQLPSASG